MLTAGERRKENKPDNTGLCSLMSGAVNCEELEVNGAECSEDWNGEVSRVSKIDAINFKETMQAALPGRLGTQMKEITGKNAEYLGQIHEEDIPIQ
ncbi:hypothetical protein BTVI_95203 [Pitangus sulphuratus]|nr:hypothetical protein BTVI_95203 [Pitangus sulphuratus]